MEMHQVKESNKKHKKGHEAKDRQVVTNHHIRDG